MANLRERVLKDSPWRAIVIAVVLLVGGELLLAWQYRQLQEGRIQDLEEKIEQQQETIEERAAQTTINNFFQARIDNQEERIVRYVTEEVMLQRDQGMFELEGVQDYVIQKKEKTGTVFRFYIEVTRERLQQIEIVEVKEISGDYYINSIQIAG